MSTEIEKLNRYFKRTMEHIHRVQNNMVFLVTNFYCELGLSVETRRHLIVNVLAHDRSKFFIAQFSPYIELTEFYYQRKTLGNKNYLYANAEIAEAVEGAIQDHYLVENHHPEAIGLTATHWTIYNALECVCDLQAMAQEFNEGSCRKYFENVWLPKHSHKFVNGSENLILAYMEKAITCFEKGAQ